MYTVSVARNHELLHGSRDDFFRELLRFSLSDQRKTRGAGLRVVNIEEARKDQKAWIFVSDKKFEIHKSCRTRFTLAGYQQSWGEYFTPNGFFNRHRREKRWLRHLNALFVDIDTEITPVEVLELVSFNCLPMPSAIVRTPGGGCHVYWFLDKPVPGTQKAISFYESLQRDLAFVLGGDLNAIGAERLMRIPPANLNHYWDLKRRYTLQTFADWRSLYFPSRGGTTVGFSVEHPGVQELLKGVELGRRNCSAFALSLHYKCLGMCFEWTFDKLTRWNKLNSPALNQRELEAVIKRVYQIERYNIYPHKKISTLSGIKARVIKRTRKKTREERVNVTCEERVEDVLALVRKHGGTLLTTVRGLAECIDASRSSVEKVLAKLKKRSDIEVVVVGKGNRQRTLIRIKHSGDPVDEITKKSKKEGQKSLSQSRIHVSSGGWEGTPAPENPLESMGLGGGSVDGSG